MAETQRRDWPKIISEIEATGMTTWKIAQMLYKDATTVKNWKAGGEPKHVDGERLLAIHAERTRIYPVSSPTSELDIERKSE